MPLGLGGGASGCPNEVALHSRSCSIGRLSRRASSTPANAATTMMPRAAAASIPRALRTRCQLAVDDSLTRTVYSGPSLP